MKDTLYDRVFGSWKSTLVGTGLIAVAVSLVYFEKATLTEAGLFVAGGIALFFKKDGKKD